jgi:hypothetical protein
MKQAPLHILVARLKGMRLPDQIAHLRMLVAHEKPFSVRRNELQSLLEGKMLRQLRKEGRAA